MRILLSWLLLIAAESVHGALRRMFLVPVVGDLRASQIGVAVACCIVVMVALFTVRWMGPRPAGGWLRVGVIWTALMLAFEFGLGRALGVSWERILRDYDPAQGGLMLVGVAVVLLAPMMAARWRGVLVD